MASLSARRAWIEIGRWVTMACSRVSLSARRAWIEMIPPWTAQSVTRVALRKESVDRNYTDTAVIVLRSESLSARRAWIEIPAWPGDGSLPAGRSPQGERG